MKKALLTLLTSFWMTSHLLAMPPVGEPLPHVVLKGDQGELVINGEPWDSATLRDKVHIVFYVDPDEKDLNQHVSKALKKEEFPLEKFASVAIINMDATMLPNWILSGALEDSQEEYPNTIYVKDYEKVLVEKWGVEDDNNDIMVISKEGTVLFSQAGELSKVDIEKLIAVIKKAI